MGNHRPLMVVGTSSYAGKSLIVAALCRIFWKHGYKVAPFKAQNMSLNSAVTPGGAEISRAQAVQAAAAGVEPRADMNPLLLKPKGGGLTQVVVLGKPYMDMSAREYYENFAMEKGAVTVEAAFKRLEREFDIIIMEGAGSPAEINLYDKDVSNMWAAEMAGADVVLIADIERGGSFASIYGTIMLLKPRHRERVKGIIINKFRGDESLLKPAIDRIESLLDIPVIGVVPFMEGLRLPEEDSQGLTEGSSGKVDIAVIKLPRISNFTDFDPLAYDERVSLRYVQSPEALGTPDALIIPGTKSTLSDLDWLKKQGFKSITDLAGTIPIIGICGGFQMLGQKIRDNGVETEEVKAMEGLGLLDVDTLFQAYDKTTVPVSGEIISDEGVFQGMKGSTIRGYEIHMGKTILGPGSKPLFKVNGRLEGASDAGGLTFGTYLHGLFDSPALRNALIEFLLKNRGAHSWKKELDVEDMWEQSLTRAAQTVEKNVDLSWFL